MDAAAIQNALRGWVAVATGITLASVIMADQDGPRPAKPFATVRLSAVLPLGAYDGVYTSMVAGTPDPREEVLVTVAGHREIVVSIQVFTATTQGSASALVLANKLKSAASLPSQQAVFDAAGASLFEVGQVRDLSAVFRTANEGRAQVDARLYATESLTETTTFIETAVVNEGDPNEFTVPEA